MTKKKPLTAAQKRVLIAKDTLKWLNDRKIKPIHGNYFVPPISSIRVDDGSKLDQVLLKVKRPCEVCALGSLFYSMVRRFDGVPTSIGATYSRGFDDHEGRYMTDLDGEDIYLKLKKYFSTGQLMLIESAFENQNMIDNDTYVEDKKLNRALDFCTFRNSPQHRMRKIMNNIIENKGEFKP